MLLIPTKKTMSKADLLYNAVVQEVLDQGYDDSGQEVRARWADGTPAHTKSLITKQIVFDGHEVPLLTSKKVAWKAALHELIWFYIKRTSHVRYLKENKVKIWNEWTREDETIGRAYGYQLGKPIRTGKWKVNAISGHGKFDFTNQVHKQINQLKTDPASRRHIISLWNIDDLWDMSLPPCVWNHQWIVQDDVLHLVVQQRSADLGLGVPFNIFQYDVLKRMVAQVTGLQAGSLTWNMNIPHIYDRHFETMRHQLTLEPFAAPTLLLDPDVKNFDDFNINSFELLGYEHHPSLSMEVAI